MKTSIAVFNSHDEALASVVLLREHHFPLYKVSLVGKAELVDDKIHLEPSTKEGLINTPVIAGTILGTTIGLLSGIGLFAIPGLGFLYGAGAIVGALGGFDLGLLAGGAGTLMLQAGIEEEHAVKYDEHLRDGKFLLMIEGSSQDAERARQIIGDAHLGFETHDKPQQEASGSTGIKHKEHIET
ncbi:MAG: hypothetical protein K0R65_308 [Crocinitomicaceae bacterium]|jgi:hypothetical protein|nr:hypothetical protein [Crocinitomicaceae bacterium]